jgi:4-alpha-glucanotransferase
MKLSPDRSLAGVLVPVFALRTEHDLGIGDTAGLRQMIDWCHALGLNLLQVLPINETSDDNSPYNAISSLALEPTTLAVTPEYLPDLAEEQFVSLARPELLAELCRGGVNYPRVRQLKRALLEAAFARFLAEHFDRDTGRARSFRVFLAENAGWVADYALFRVLMEANGGSPAFIWWPVEHQDPARARAWLLAQPVARREALTRQQLFFAYVQWIAYAQWTAVKAYGSERSVFLMGDIPFGVGRYSADVWANRDLFDLTWSGGAPPEKVFKVDAFTEKWGQNWGIPNYDWAELRRQDFSWWRTRVGNIQQVFHLYRIDHVLGFFRIYSFPWTPDRNDEFLPLTEPEAALRTSGRLPGFKAFPDDTPEHQAGNQAQGEEILRVVQAASGDTTVVAEDLGVVPPYVPPTLLKLGMPGFRIPMLFREPDGRYADPRGYPRLSLAQPTTHDHPPLAAAWAEGWARLDAGHDVAHWWRELRHFLAFAGWPDQEPPRDFTDELHTAFTRAVLGANSWLAVFQITDVFGMTERFNTPGSVAAANWSHRLPHTVKELSTDPRLRAKADTFARLAREAGRGL